MLYWLRYLLFKFRRNRYLRQMYLLEDPWSSKLTERELTSKIQALLQGLAFESVLDIGCGEGLYTGALTAGGKIYLGVDVSTPALKRARAANPGVRFEKCDFDSLGGLGKKFDLVVFNFVLDYLGFQDHPHQFAAYLYELVATSLTDNAAILILNPVYKTESWDRLQKYQYLLESFGFKTLHRELLKVPEMQVGVLLLKRKAGTA